MKEKTVNNLKDLPVEKILDLVFDFNCYSKDSQIVCYESFTDDYEYNVTVISSDNEVFTRLTLRDILELTNINYLTIEYCDLGNIYPKLKYCYLPVNNLSQN